MRIDVVSIFPEYLDPLRYALLGKAIEALPPRESCEALDKSAERVVKRMARRHQAEQLAFDRAEHERLEQLLRKASNGDS